ncbi:unnamed protein product [Symbiodinium sp. KB8]|nr:unnamed protein product [Symbiodinium sp. KB8]
MPSFLSLADLRHTSVEERMDRLRTWCMWYKKQLLGAEKVVARMYHEHQTSKLYTATALGEIMAQRVWTSFNTINSNRKQDPSEKKLVLNDKNQISEKRHKMTGTSGDSGLRLGHRNADAHPRDIPRRRYRRVYYILATTAFTTCVLATNTCSDLAFLPTYLIFYASPVATTCDTDSQRAEKGNKGNGKKGKFGKGGMEPVIVDAADGQLAHRKRLRWTSIGWKDAEAKLARCTPWSLTWNSEDEWQRLHNPMALDLQTPIHSRKVSHCPVAFSRATDVFIASLLFPSSRTVGPCPNLTDHGSSPKRRHNAGRPTANDTVLGNLRGTSTAPTVVGEQLQGLPPSYTEDLANGDETRRNIALGNAWRLPTAVWIIFLVLVATAGFPPMGKLTPEVSWHVRQDKKYLNPTPMEEFKNKNHEYFRGKIEMNKIDDHWEFMLDEIMGEVKFGRMNLQGSGLVAETSDGKRWGDEDTPGEDWRRSGHNATCIMHDQPVHHTPDHFVSLGLAFPEQSRETPLKVWGHDHDGAYRQLPLHDPREACVLLRTPFGPALWSHNVLLFGSAASVWSYSRFGDVLVACSRTTVLSPALHYVDDYGSMEDQSSADSSFRAFEDYSGCLEISMKPSKRKPPETHHGIQGVLISSDAENLVLTPCPARIKAMSQQIDKRLHTNQLTPAEARKMAGKCNFQSRAPLWQSWPRGTLCQSLYRPGDDDLPTWDVPGIDWMLCIDPSDERPIRWRRIRNARTKLAAAVDAGNPDEMLRACEEVEVSGADATGVPAVRHMASVLGRLASLCEPDEIEKACGDAEAAGVDEKHVQAFRQKACMIRKVLRRLAAAEHSGDAVEMREACDEAEASGAAAGRVPAVRHMANVLGRLASLCEPDEIEKACGDAEAAGVDEQHVQAFRQKACMIQRVLQRLAVAEHSGDAVEMHEACDEAEVLGAAAGRVHAVRLKANIIRAEDEVNLQLAAMRVGLKDLHVKFSAEDSLHLLTLLAATLTTLQSKLIVASKCVSCSEALLEGQAPVCSQGTHSLCPSCFEKYARAEQDQPEAVIRQRRACLECPCRAPADACCNGSFSEQTMAKYLPSELFETHMALQRQQIRAEEHAKANQMLNKLAAEWERQVPGLSQELLANQLKAALPGSLRLGAQSVFRFSQMVPHSKRSVA